MELSVIINLALGLITTVFAGGTLIFKRKLNQFKNVIKEGYDVVKVSIEAGDDNQFSKGEYASIKKEAIEFWDAVKILVGKKEPEVA